MLMLNFVTKYFRKIVDLILWIILVICAIGGAVSGNEVHKPIIGLISGIFAGLLINIIWGGLLATILNIDKGVKNMNKWLQCIWQHQINTDANQKLPIPIDDDDIYYFDSKDNSSDSINAINKTITPVSVEVGSFIDTRDNKTYKTVKIGTQTWMAENLAYECDGSKCYDNNPANGEKYGRLYDWETAKKACPTGWHLPSDKEWQELVNLTGGNKTAGNMLKASNGWDGNGNGTDTSSFSALPGGYGYSDGGFKGVGKDGNWWSATESYTSHASSRNMGYNGADVGMDSVNKSTLFSVRCVQD